MRYLIIIKASDASEAGVPPTPALIEQMTAFHQTLAREGVLLDAAGLLPSRHGWRIRHQGGARTLAVGPFTPSNGLIAGYTLIEARSDEEAREWSMRYPNPAGADGSTEIEVRPLMQVDCMPPDDDALHESVQQGQRPS